MEREYDSGTANSVTYFTGIEIEQTPAYGKKTLFVVGLQNPREILQHAKENECTHIYFGANQSFTNPTPSMWKQWEYMIMSCLDDYWCTLDLDIKYVEDLLEGPLVEQRKFIPQLSVKLPYLQQLGYNATIKLDDKGFNATNHGVWCHKLHDLTTRDSFTAWDEYGQDKIIK